MKRKTDFGALNNNCDSDKASGKKYRMAGDSGNMDGRSEFSGTRPGWDTVGNEAFSNDVILLEVLSHFRCPEDVRKFRLLNRKCYELGSIALLRGRTGCEELVGELHLHPYMSEAKKNLLRAHGSAAKRVKITSKCVSSFGGGFLGYVLLEKLTQLEDLSIDVSSSLSLLPGRKGKRGWDVLRPGDSLPTVKRMKICGIRQLGSRSVSEILEAAENLKEVSAINLTLLPLLASSKRKTVPVKSLDWDLFFRPQDLSLPLELNFQLEKFSVLGQIFVDSVDILNHILESSRETLREFHVETRAVNLMAINLPRLSNVTTLTWTALLRVAQHVGTATLLDRFPHLCCVVNGADETPNFTNIGQFPCVTTFKCNGRLNSFAGIERVFPKLKEIRINWGTRDRQDYTLWLLPPTVELIALENFHLLKYEFYGLDAFFTGIPKKVCKNLQKLKKDCIPTEKLKEKRGISSLSNLKRLEIKCVKEDLRILRDDPIVTHISRWCALDLLPDLRLEFTFPGTYFVFDRKKHLEAGLKLFHPLADISTVFFE